MTSVPSSNRPDLLIALVDNVLASSSGDTNTGERKKTLLLGGNFTAAMPTPVNWPVCPSPNLHGNVL